MTDSERLIGLRKRAGITQARLAEAIGMNLRQYQKLEAGEYPIGHIRFEYGVKIAKSLGISPEKLLENS